tara:strand:+ start:3054 stop:3689 length:636 start_codon:yes stop_codon:yes gene_type:complete
MTDVRLTALNPVDSQVYPVACNTSGELIVEQVDPGPDLTVTGNLTVDGTATFDSTTTFDGNVTAASEVLARNINTNFRMGRTGAVFQGYFGAAGDDPALPTSLIDNDGNIIAASVQATTPRSSTAGSDTGGLSINPSDTTIYYSFRVDEVDNDLRIDTSAGADKIKFTPNGGIISAGDITCSDNTKGLVLKSPNGTSYRLTVANDGTLGTE